MEAESLDSKSQLVYEQVQALNPSITMDKFISLSPSFLISKKADNVTHAVAIRLR